VVVVAVTLQIIPFFPVQNGKWAPKSSPTASNNTCLSNPFPRFEAEAEQEALRMKQLFESAGVTEISYQKMNNTAFYLEIVPPDKPSQALLDLWDEENINPKLSQDCPISFIFIAPEE
jgi:nucleotide-binding universal stress UspA family protein